MEIKRVGVCGAGTMGAGIAQVFAQNGYETILFDVNLEQLQKANNSILNSLNRLVVKGKLTEEVKNSAVKNLTTVNNVNEVKADLIIEAVVERLDIKLDLFSKLIPLNSSETLFVSNTSSLSITQIAAGILNPERFAGLHFFNPAPVMKLVEIIGSTHTSNATIKILKDLIKSIGKNSVVCKDSPGFIVNRVARNFYTESLKLAEEKVADFEKIDILLESAGFKMGAFKLMDTIGNDINFAVTNSLFQAFHGEAKFRPSLIQEQKVKANQLGIKTGQGFYKYSK